MLPSKLIVDEPHGLSARSLHPLLCRNDPLNRTSRFSPGRARSSTGLALSCRERGSPRSYSADETSSLHQHSLLFTCISRVRNAAALAETNFPGLALTVEETGGTMRIAQISPLMEAVASQILRRHRAHRCLSDGRARRLGSRGDLVRQRRQLDDGYARRGRAPRRFGSIRRSAITSRPLIAMLETVAQRATNSM